MSSQQLVDDYNQLKKLLRAYPDIFILKTTGQPPDNYEIEYSIRGYVKDTDDQINIGDRHRVRISLPFGYPHFAPIAKPLSPIFHPDVDPASIRIAEWWAQNPSLPKLVLHIGEMICGKAYNLDDPFSPEAAEWYITYKNQLPLDELQALDVEEAEDSPLSLELGNLGLERESADTPEMETAPPAISVEEHQPDETDIEHIHKLIAANRIFEANSLLTAMPAHVRFPEREDLQKDIAKILRKTDQLFGLVEQLENLRKYADALEAAENIASIANDAPGLEEIQTRLKEAIAAEAASDDRAQKIKKAQWERAKRQAKEKQSAANLRAILLPLAVVLFLGVCGTAGWLFYQDKQTLESASNLLNEGQKQIKNLKFTEAKNNLEQAQSELKTLVVLQFLDQQVPIQSEIERTLRSKVMQEGLKGRVFYEGQYVSVREVERRKEFQALKDKAMTLAEEDRLAEALEAYTNAVTYAEKEGFQEEKAFLDEHFYPLVLRHVLSQAEQAEQAGDLDQAASLYRQIQEFSSEGPQLPGLTEDVDQKLSEITFRKEIDISRQAFIKSQWEQTILSLERAQQYALEHPHIGTEKDRQDLQRLLDNARLNMHLASAKEAFLSRKWQVAIENYTLALNLLSSRASSLRQVDDEIINKIKRILLHVRIMETQEAALAAEAQQNLSDVIKYNRATQNLITESQFSNAPELQRVLTNTGKKIAFASKELSKKEQLAWLQKNYERIFRANYPTIQGSQLLKPNIVFVKNVGNNPVYSLTCLERDLGRTSKISLLYMYNTSAQKWQVYSDR